MNTVTSVGFIISNLTLALTILTYALFKCARKDIESHTICNLAGVLLLINVTFLAGIERVQWMPGCILVAILLHYFTLVSFAWILAEAIVQYLKFVKVFGINISYFIRKTAICAWGIPLIAIVAVLANDYEVYQTEKYCWMKPGATYFSVILPVAILVLIHTAIFTMVVYSVFNRHKGLRTNQPMDRILLSRLRITLSRGTLLVSALTWPFAFLAIEKEQQAFYYLFSVFASLQGLSTFIILITIEKAWKDILSQIRAAVHMLPSQQSNNPSTINIHQPP